MNSRKLIAGVAGVAVIAVAGSGVATAQKAPKAPSKATVKEAYSLKMKPNRYIQDGMRWNKDVYTIKKGGTLTLLGNKLQEGPHSLTIVKPSQLPKTAAQAFNCKVCNSLGEAHGADPNSEGPPKFQFLENGKGQNTAPALDRPGDSAIVGLKKGEKLKFKVTAKAGKTLSFLCGFHPWMQAKIKVVK
jgi:hypothetical protein